MTPLPKAKCGQSWAVAGTDGVSPSKTFVFTSRLDAGKHLESVRSVSQTDSWLLAPSGRCACFCLATEMVQSGRLLQEGWVPSWQSTPQARRWSWWGFPLPGDSPIPPSSNQPFGSGCVQQPFAPSIAANALTSAPRSAGDGVTPVALLGIRIPSRIGCRSLGGDVTPGHEAVFRKNSRTRSQSLDSQIHI